MKNKEPAQYRAAGGVRYEFKRKRVKNINLRVRADGSVAASASVRVPVSYVDAFVAARADWVRSAQARAAVRREREEAERPELPAKADALAHMQALCRVYYPQFAASCPGGHMPKIAVRDMTTRWGSCSSAGNLNYNWKLVLMPERVMDYVVIHELAHRKEMNHSARFYAVVAQQMPDYKVWQSWLKEHGREY